MCGVHVHTVLTLEGRRGDEGTPPPTHKHTQTHPLTPLEGGSQERVNSAPTLLNTLPDITGTRAGLGGTETDILYSVDLVMHIVRC